MYTIRFTDGEEETWSAHYVTVNSKAASNVLVDVGFQFIQLFHNGGHFSGIVIEILRSGKRRCRFCDRKECRYNMNNLQRLSSLQVIHVHLEKSNDSESDDDVSLYCTDKEHYNEEDSN